MKQTSIVKSFLVLLIAILVNLAGCGVIKDRSGDYVDEKEGSGVVVPPWYTQDDIREVYPVAEISNNKVLSKDYVLPPPPDATLYILKEQFTVEVQDDYVWLLVNEPPSRVWASLEFFFRSQGIIFDFSDPKNGLAQGAIRGNSALGVAFLEELGLPAGQDTVIMIKVQQGIKKNSSEAQVRLITNANTRQFYTWDGNESKAALEKTVLEKAKDFLVENQERKTYSLLASDISGPAKVALMSGDNQESYLLLDLDYDRAWHVILRALRDGGVPVADIDRSAGMIYLDVKDNDMKCLFWGMFCREEKIKAEYDYKVTLIRENASVRVFVANMIDPDDKEGQAQLLSLLLDNAS